MVLGTNQAVEAYKLSSAKERGGSGLDFKGKVSNSEADAKE